MQIVDLKQSHRTEIATATEASQHAITTAEQASNSVLFYLLQEFQRLHCFSLYEPPFGGVRVYNFLWYE